MALSNYQFQFGSFVFGAGTPFAVMAVDGLEALPGLRVTDDGHGLNDGAFYALTFPEATI
jgi:hypothetical protein